MDIPGSSKKSSHQPKVATSTESPRTPCLNVANHRFSMAGARMAVFFLKAPRSTAVTQHWNWGQGVSNFPRQTSSWLAVFFEEPGMVWPSVVGPELPKCGSLDPSCNLQETSNIVTKITACSSFTGNLPSVVPSVRSHFLWKCTSQLNPWRPKRSALWPPRGPWA